MQVTSRAMSERSAAWAGTSIGPRSRPSRKRASELWRRSSACSARMRRPSPTSRCNGRPSASMRPSSATTSGSRDDTSARRSRPAKGRSSREGALQNDSVGRTGWALAWDRGDCARGSLPRGSLPVADELVPGFRHGTIAGKCEGEEGMAGPGSGATEMRSEEWLAAFAKLLMGPDGLEQGWLVLRDLFHSLTDEEMAVVVHWCEVW